MVKAEISHGVGMEEVAQSACFSGHVSRCATEPDSHDLTGKRKVKDVIYSGLAVTVSCMNRYSNIGI